MGKLNKIKSLIIAWVGHGNFGDELIAYALRRYLKSKGINQVTYYTSGDQDIYKGKDDIDVKVLYPDSIPAKLRKTLDYFRLKKFNQLLIGGGSIFHSLNSINWKWEVIKKMKANNLAQIISLGVSFGPFKNEQAKQLCLDMLADNDAVITRDDYSEKLFGSSMSGHDLSFILADSCRQISAEVVTDNNLVGLIFVQPRNDSSFNIEQAKEMYRKIIRRYLNQGKKVKLISLYAGQDYLDHQLVDELQKEFEQVTSHKYSNDIFETLKQIATCSQIVSMRLHGCVAAYLLQVPFAAIGFQPKLLDFIQTTGYPSNLWIDLNDDIEKLQHLDSSDKSIFANCLSLDHIKEKLEQSLDQVFSSQPEIRPLVISFWTPPATRPQSILIGKMIPEWQRQGMKPVVVRAAGQGEWSAAVPVFSLPTSIFSYLKRLSFMRHLIDRFEIFVYSIYAARLVKKYNCNLIFGFANPQTCNILGARLSQKLNLPFVSHFSDPWVDNPLKEVSADSDSYNRLLEQEVVSTSAKVIFTNQQAQDLIMKKYDLNQQDKATVVPHCFDTSLYPSKTQSPSVYTFAHIGAFYEQRNPESFFKALQQLKSITHTPFKVLLVGGAVSYTKYSKENLDKLISQYNLSDVVEVQPPVEYLDSLDLMKKVNCLVVIDVDLKDSPFLPSKLIDYAGAGADVIGLAYADSPTAQFLDRAGYINFSFDQTQELSRYMQHLLRGETNQSHNQNVIDEYDVKATTKQYLQIFSTLV